MKLLCSRRHQLNSTKNSPKLIMAALLKISVNHHVYCFELERFNIVFVFRPASPMDSFILDGWSRLKATPSNGLRRTDSAYGLSLVVTWPRTNRSRLSCLQWTSHWAKYCFDRLDCASAQVVCNIWVVIGFLASFYLQLACCITSFYYFPTIRPSNV